MTEALTPKGPNDPAERPRKSCLGCAFKGGLGCLAFFLGVGVIVGIFGPSWAADWMLVGAREAFNESRKGSVECSDFEMSWTETQYVRSARLLDPEGKSVLEFDLELPGLFSMAELFVGGNSTVDLGRIVCNVRGEIIADETGVTNLDRALEKTWNDSGHNGSGRGEVITGDINGQTPEEFLADKLTHLEFVLDVKSRSLLFSNPQTQALDKPVELRNLEARLRARPGGGAWTFTADADIVSEEDGRLDLSLTAWDPNWHNSEWPLGVVGGEVDVRGLSTTLIDGLLGQEGRLVELLGPSMTVDLDVDDVTANGGRLKFGLESERQEASLTGHFEGGSFRMSGGEKFGVILDLPRAQAETLAAEFLPSDLKLVLPEDEARLTFELSELSMPVVREHIEEAREARVRLTDMLSDSTFEMYVSLGGFALQREGAGEIRVDKLLLTGSQAEQSFVAGVQLDLSSDSTEVPAQVSLDIRPRDVWESLLTKDAQLAWEADATVSQLALTALLDDAGVKVEQLSHFAGLYEGSLHVRDGLNANARLSGDLSRDSLRLSLSDLWTDNADLVRSGESDALVLVTESADLAQLVAELAPEGMRLALPDGTQRLIVESCSLPRKSADNYEFDLEDLEARVRFEANALAVTLEGSEQIAFEDILGTLVLEADAMPRLELAAGIRGHEECTLNVEATSLASWNEVLAAEDHAQLQFALDAKAAAVPSAIVDRVAEQDGLIVDVLGPSLDLDCQSSALSLEAGPLVVHMDSELGTLDWAGQLKDGVLLSSGEDRLEAKVGLSPLLGERVIGSLVPMLVQAKKEPDAEPVFLSVRDCSLPLGGDLSQLNGKLRLELGAVQYRVLPQFEEFLGESTRLKSSLIEPLDINIVNGIASYEGLAIEIGDKVYDFKGAIILATSTLDFQTEIPLKNLGSRAGKNVERLVRKGVVSGDLAVPVTLRGSIQSPRVGLADGFLEDLTKDLAPDALEGLLRTGLDKLLGKD